MSEAVHAREKSGSQERCPYCHEDFAAAPQARDADERVTCAGCGTPHHAECFAEHGGCSSLGCERAVARVAGGTEIRVGPLVRVHEPTREGLSGLLLGLGLVMVALGTAFSPFSFEGVAPAFVGIGVLFLLLGGALRLLGRATGLLPLEAVAEQPAPFAPTRPPTDAVDAAQRLNLTASRRSTGTLPVPTGPPGVCPACSRALEAVADLRFCYHCGASLG